jgi:hypothetical protein
VTRKFSLGQDVVFTPGSDFVIRVPTRGKITRLLPKEGTQYQYHIQLGPDSQQRMGWESQLRFVAEGSPPGGSDAGRRAAAKSSQLR